MERAQPAQATVVVSYTTPPTKGAHNVQIDFTEARLAVYGRPDYSLRVRPYRTADNKIDGVVIALVDLEGRNDSDARKTPKRAKQIVSHK